MRHDSEHGHARPRREEIEPGSEHTGIAAEAIDDEPRDARAIVGGEQRERADEGGEDAAALDVAHQQHGRARESRHAHVGEIELEIDLRGTAGALDDDQIVRAAQPVEALDDHGPERRRQASIAAPVETCDGAAAHDDLRALVGFGLQQDRVHVDGGLDAGGGRLHGLRPADLAAVRGHGGVERHVLRLERRHAVAGAREDSTQGGGEQALADAGGGALHHEARREPHRRAAAHASTKPRASAGLDAKCRCT